MKSRVISDRTWEPSWRYVTSSLPAENENIRGIRRVIVPPLRARLLPLCGVAALLSVHGIFPLLQLVEVGYRN